MTSSVDNLGMLQELRFRRGATLQIMLHLFAEEIGGTPYDMTGCEVRAIIKPRTGNTVYNFGFPVPPDSSGLVQAVLDETVAATIPASPVSQMAAPIYDWYVDIKLADGTIVPFCYGPAYCIEGGASWS